MIDAHTHLQMEPLRSQIESLLTRAHVAEVSQMVLVGVDLDSSHKAIELCSEFEGMFPTVGVHPSDGVKNNIGELDTEEGRGTFVHLASDKRVCAIGETGLDYHWIDRHDEEKRQQQWRSFIFQIEESIKLDLPLIIHSREAEEDTLQIIGKHQPVRALMHCFSYDVNTAEAFLELNPDNMIAFTGIVTFPSAKDLQEVARYIPLERILTESDCPYLAPQKYRGQQNEPSYITEIALKIAELKGLSFDEVAQQTTQNAVKFFGLSV